MIIFDVETTGLDVEVNQICQLSYIKTDEKYNIEYAKNFYFSVNRMERGAERTHGLSKELLEELSEGRTFEDCSDEIYTDFKNENKLYIGHNIEFDSKFLGKEFERLNLECEFLYNYKKQFCTMHSYTDIVAIGYNAYYGSYKWPRLEEVLAYLNINIKDIKEKTKEIFNVSSDDIKAHDSRFDIVATREIARFYDEVDRLKKFRRINENICDIEKSLEKIKKCLEFAKEHGRYMSIYDLEEFNDFYMNLEDENRIYEIAKKGARAFSSLANMEKEELERREKVKELELKELIKESIKSGIKIKAVTVYNDNWEYSKEVLFYDAQVTEEECYCSNIELIPLGNNKYLKLTLNKDSNSYDYYNVIEVSGVPNTEEDRVFDSGKEEFDILYNLSAPEVDNIDDALKLNTRDYITINNPIPRLDEINESNQKYSLVYDDYADEIPF